MEISLATADLDDQLLGRLLALVHKATGITMTASRKTMLQSRLRPRMRKLGLTSYEAYLDRLESDATEVPYFVDLVTTNETYFYRTPRIWEYLSGTFLPAWKGKSPLRVWSAAASSGEEAFTTGMFCEAHRAKTPGFEYQITGTDISDEILEKANAARYAGRSIEALRIGQPALYQRYLKEEGDAFVVDPAIRQRVRFLRHNLFEPLRSGERFDLVFLRNVLIYFTAADQERVIALVRKAMGPSTILIIGESESLNRLEVPFTYQSPLIYRANPNALEKAA